MGMCMLAMGNQTAGQAYTVFKSQPNQRRQTTGREIRKKEMCALTIFLYV